MINQDSDEFDPAAFLAEAEPELLAAVADDKVHEVLPPDALGVPYFRAVQGPDGRWDWGQCPRCGELVRAGEGRFGRHWDEASARDARAAR